MIRKNLMGIPVQYCPNLKTVLGRGAARTGSSSNVWKMKLPDRRWDPAWGESPDRWRINMTLVCFERGATREDLVTFARANNSRLSYPREGAELARADPWLNQALGHKSIVVVTTKSCPLTIRKEEEDDDENDLCLIGIRFAPPDHRILFPYRYWTWPEHYWFLFVDRRSGPHEPIPPKVRISKLAGRLPITGQRRLPFA